MTEGSKQAPSWSFLGKKASRIARERFLSGDTELPDQDISDWEIEDFPEATLVDAADSVDSFPSEPVAHKFDSFFADFWDPKGKSGMMAALGITSLIYATNPEVYVEEPFLVTPAYAAGAALVATGALSYNSQDRFKQGVYDGMLHNDGRDLRLVGGHRGREEITETIEETDQVAVNFLDDDINKYRDRKNLEDGEYIVDFLRQANNQSEQIDLWLSRDGEDPIWTLHVEGTYEDGEDYQMVLTGFNPEYETDEIRPDTYEEILDELYGDSYRDYSFPEDAEHVEKELQIES